MEKVILQEIKDGDSGSIAAKKILNNDQKLKNAVTYLQDYLEGYGAFVDVQLSGGSVTIAFEPGSSNTSVMTQKATTDFVNDKTNKEFCLVGTVVKGDVQMPENCEIVPGLWATRASQNAEGHSLTELYNDVEDLKKLYDVIADINAQIQALGDRVTVLEARMDGLN